VSQTPVTAYLTDAKDYLASRKPGTTGPVTWYNGTGTGPGGRANTIVPVNKNTAYIIKLYASLYHAVTP
jgi:hypothetical protein